MAQEILVPEVSDGVTEGTVISLAVAEGDAGYVQRAHDHPGAPDELPLDEVPAKLKPGRECRINRDVCRVSQSRSHLLGHGIPLLSQQASA